MAAKHSIWSYDVLSNALFGLPMWMAVLFDLRGYAFVAGTLMVSSFSYHVVRVKYSDKRVVLWATKPKNRKEEVVRNLLWLDTLASVIFAVMNIILLLQSGVDDLYAWLALALLIPGLLLFAKSKGKMGDEYILHHGWWHTVVIIASLCALLSYAGVPLVPAFITSGVSGFVW